MSALAEADWIKEQFDRCWPFLEPALAYSDGTYDRAFVWNAVRAGRAQIWPGHGAAVVTQLDDHPDGSRSCLEWLAGGDLAELKRMEAGVVEWARSRGCTQMRIVGREGWLRALPGYRKQAVVMTKDISNG